MKSFCWGLTIAAWLAAASATAQQLPPTLTGQASIYRDVDGIVHIVAQTERDLIYAQGWAHARDRFFQMDSLRRQASGTLAELLGAAAVGDDILLRTLGLRRAAERSLGAISEASLSGLAWYAEGVNAWLATHPLPPEYEALEISSVAPWEPLDSLTIAKLLAFGLSFDLDVDLTQRLVEYQTVGAGAGFDGAALFFEDLFRSQPFDIASTVPDALGIDGAAAGKPGPNSRHWQNLDTGYLDTSVVAGAADFAARLAAVPVIGAGLKRRDGIVGSNEWGVSGAHTASGRPMIANDPHLALNTPATFYQNHLRAPQAGFDVVGSSFTGVPLVVLGQNRRITWGATTNPLDVTDTFQEQLVADPNSPIGFGTVTDGVVEPLDFLLLSFFANTPGDGVLDNLVPVGDAPPLALIVPRRNNGPIVSVDFTSMTAISIQFTGFGPTREVDAFRAWNLAHDLDDFVAGLDYFDFGSQNWAYTDVDGNLAYFTSGELPLREDLQANTVNGLPPFFIRDGTGGNEWLPVGVPEPGQATPSAILPFDEMPQIVNPPLGFFVNANNDPIGNTLDNDPLNEQRPGGGIYYLNPGYAIGTRAGRITQALTAAMNAGPVDLDTMADIQANVRLLDAEFFTPYLVAALSAAQGSSEPALAGYADDPRVVEAVGRLADWDYSTPTGVIEGYDAADPNGLRLPPTADEIDASVAATIYSVWRGQFVRRTIDATLNPLGLSSPGSAQSMTALKNLVQSFPVSGGVGASGLDFFADPALVDPADRLNARILDSLVAALDRLGGEPFAAAFGGSINQADYRWGRLHRIVLDHPLGEPFSLPSLAGPLAPSFDDLPGFAVDGGFGAVDASSHSARADNASAFMFGSGPVRRYVGEPGTAAGSILARTSLPGGSSGVPGSPWYANLLERWLTNDAYPVRQAKGDLKPVLVELTILSTVNRGIGVHHRQPARR